MSPPSDAEVAELIRPLARKIAEAMSLEPIARHLRPEVLGRLAAQATTAAAAFIGNPLAGHHCASCEGHSRPDVG